MRYSAARKGGEKLLNGSLGDQSANNAVSVFPSRCQASFCRAVLRSGAGEAVGKAGESTGEGDQQGKEELECFDAMQTDSTEARRQKFSTQTPKRQERLCTGAIRRLQTGYSGG